MTSQNNNNKIEKNNILTLKINTETAISQKNGNIN